MLQTSYQRRASDRVAAWLAHNSRNAAWLVDAIDADPRTVANFLNGQAWPAAATRQKVELALGWPAGGIGQIGTGISPAAAGAFVEDPAFTHHRPRSVATPGEHSKQGATNDEVLAMTREVAQGLTEVNRRLDRVEQWLRPHGDR